MKKYVFSFIFGIAVSMPISPEARELLPILYSKEGQLCSTIPTGANHFCIRSKKDYDSPSWQPNGNHIVVESGYHDGAHELELLKKDGTLIRRLPESSEFIRPAWSPNGKYIYGLSYSHPKLIRRWDKEGKGFIDIPVRGAKCRYQYLQAISFDPSNKRAVILLDNFDIMFLVAVHEDHFQVIKMLPKSYSYVSQSVWLDDKTLLFVGIKTGSRNELWKLDVDSEDTQKVGVPELWLRDYVTLSPDKKTVVVCAMPDTEQSKWSLWRYTIGTPRAERITDGTEDVSPNWRGLVATSP